MTAATRRRLICLIVAAIGAGAVAPAAQATFPGTNGKLFAITGPTQAQSARDLISLKTDGSDKIVITSGIVDGIQPRLSPDGKLVLYTFTQSGKARIGAVSSDGATKSTFTSTGFDHMLFGTWNADGSRVFFSGVPTGKKELNLYSMALNGSDLKQITTGIAALGPDVSPGGGSVAFWGAGASDTRYRVYTVNIDGSGLKAITGADVNSYTPSWSPSGGLLAFSSAGADGKQDVWRAAGDGSQAVNLTANGPAIDFGIPVWAPAGDKIAFETVDDSSSRTRLGTVGAAGNDAAIVPGVDRLAFHDWGVDVPTGGTNECGDGEDNDDDGKVDAADPECANGGSSESPASECNDGQDNDNDGKKDAEDPDCANGGTSESPNECTDGVDNDEDGKKDAEDPDCANGSKSESPPNECTDEIDNDQDGQTDADDPDCADGSTSESPAEEGCPPEAGPISGIVLDPIATTLGSIDPALGDLGTQIGCLVYDLVGL